MKETSKELKNVRWLLLNIFESNLDTLQMAQLSITNFVRIYQKNTTCYLLIEKERIKYGRDVEKNRNSNSWPQLMRMAARCLYCALMAAITWLPRIISVGGVGNTLQEVGRYFFRKVSGRFVICFLIGQNQNSESRPLIG